MINTESRPSPFVLLDDCSATEEKPRSRLYREFVREILCGTFDGLAAAEAALQEDLAHGFYAVLLCDYELGAGLVGIDPYGRVGFLRFLVFRRVEWLSSTEVEDWLAGVVTGECGFFDLESNIDRAGFDEAIATIQDRIRRGDTYQVNFTYRLKFNVFGDPLALYRRLRKRQPAVYGAAVVLPGDRWILSFSPELFLRCRAGRLTSAPIKGTSEWMSEVNEDFNRRFALSLDPKSRAENLMIVDLLRNDLGRIARVGSVIVPSLFEVEKFGAMLHLVSTIEAQVRQGCTLSEVLTALFPCGSITGAPKRSTMEIIRELEPDRRGIYTGAIGWIDPPMERAEKNDLPDFCLSVAIRTLELEAGSEQADARPDFRHGVMGVGAGIVYESDPDLEHSECELKSSFLTGLDPGFELIETMYAEAGKGCRHLERHLRRLDLSAARFKFRWEEYEIRQAIERAIGDLPGGSHRIRLSLNSSGQTKIVIERVLALSGKVEIGLASEPIYSEDVFLQHKTTFRTRYDKALKLVAELELFDLLFFNERGELCEGARSNVFVKAPDGWLTPPLHAGLLPGVMRAVLLEDSSLGARERTLYLEDLLGGEAIFICNALRGRLDCKLRNP